MNDNRAPEHRQEDWAGRFQPMYAVTDTDTTSSPNPAPPSPPRRRPRRLWLLVVFLPLCLMTYLLPTLDLLILGVDARPGEGYLTRTDSIMLLGVQPRRARLSLLSIPRDLFVPVPNYGERRINTVNLLGEMEEEGTGPALLAAAIQSGFDVEVDHYVRLNFDAFVQLVDAVGGVRIDIPRPIVDYQYPTENYGTMTVRFEQGIEHMDGERALIYARTRHADDDYGRAERQQQVLNALALKLVNPLNWLPALNVVNQNMETDMPIWKMPLYAPAVVTGAARMERLVIDRDYILPGAQGAVPNYEKLSEWIDPRFD
jgi:LCP family protein required for cell wall assembly